MIEGVMDLRHEPRDRAYALLHSQMLGVLAGLDDDITGMATLASLLHFSFGHLWTGFYRVVGPELLRVGPYQGTLGCLEIAFGRGVCGTSAAERRTVIVPDVSRFPGHITCDARSKSEIVVPVFDRAGSLIAVLDIDSERRATFDQSDADGLERIVRWFAGEGRG
ncbi:MAG TPA: GAF domain-containing protein [Gemmatimonadaceae bacterium]|nr:GAF domain-containing protein [Gemmatimonadaceae bacterium]